jgi:hypothetical protein
LAQLGLVGAAALALTGCPEQAADIVEIKGTSLDFAVAAVAPAVFPAGGAERERVAFGGFFPDAVPDAFGRSSWLGTDPALPGYNRSPGHWIWGGPADASVDGRAPTLLQQTPVIVGTGLLVEAPFDQGGPYYNLWVSGNMQGLAPNTQYTVAFVRYGTDVKAELDQEAVLLGQPITQPDSLVVLDPNPLGDPNVDINFSTTGNEGDTIPAQPGGNPFIIGNATVDAAGASDFGIMISASDAVTGGNPYFWTDDVTNPPTAAMVDSAMFGRNDDVAFAPTSYNYIVMFEGLGVDGPTVARWQVAQDLDLNGQPLQNGQMPFPAEALTQEELEATPGAATRVDSLTVELFNLETLGGSDVYQVWMVNRDTEPAAYLAGEGTYDKIAILREIDPTTGEIISETDSILETVTGTSTFAGQLVVNVPGRDLPQEVKHRFTLVDTVGYFTDIVVSTEEGGPQSEASDAQFMWAQYTDMGSEPDNPIAHVPGPGVAVFGEFDPDPLLAREFTDADIAQASGVGSVLDLRDERQVSVEIRNLPLPPIGWYYEGWLTHIDGNTLSLGPITSLPPDSVSLFDADVDQGLPGVTATGLRFGVAAAVLETGTIVGADGTVNLSAFFLTLEPKLGAVSKHALNVEAGSLPTRAIQDRQGSQ